MTSGDGERARGVTRGAAGDLFVARVRAPLAWSVLFRSGLVFLTSDLGVAWEVPMRWWSEGRARFASAERAVSAWAWSSACAS